MNETIDCIFGNAKVSELAARVMKKTIKSQKRIVKAFRLFVVVTAFYITGINACFQKQAIKIQELEAKIKELTPEKGE